MKLPILLVLLLAALLLGACGGEQVILPTAENITPVASETAAPATKTSEPVPVETTPPQPPTPTEISAPAMIEENVEITDVEPTTAADPTGTVEPTIEVLEPTTVQVISGQTAEGAYFYGNPDAAVTLLDYSDFL